MKPKKLIQVPGSNVNMFFAGYLPSIPISPILAMLSIILKFIKHPYMKTSLDKFRAKLIIKMLYAGSFQELKRFVDAALNALKKGTPDISTVTTFIDKVLHQLEFIASLTTNPVELGNITKAKSFLLSGKAELSNMAM